MADIHPEGVDLELLLLMGDAGVSGDEDSHPSIGLLGEFAGPFCLPNKILDVVWIDNTKVFDAASLDQFFKREGAAGMTVGGHARFRSRLHPGHGRDGIVEDHENEPGPIIHGIEESLRSGVVEGRVSNRGDDGDVFAVLVIGLVEAARKGDGSSHVVAGIDRIHVHSKGIASDVAGKDTVGEGPLEGKKGGPVRTSGAEGGPADGQARGKPPFFHRSEVEASSLKGMENLFARVDKIRVTVSGQHLPFAGDGSVQPSQNFGLVPDLKFDDRFGFFKDQDMIAFLDEGLHHSRWEAGRGFRS